MSEFKNLGIAKAVSAKIASDIYDVLKTMMAKAAKFTISEMEIGFSSYIEASYAKYSKVKTIINRFQPVDLVEIYEECCFARNDFSDEINEADLWDSSNDLRRIIVSGTAGSGKSLFMKRSFLRFCEINLNALPIFIELRAFNQSQSPNIKKHILSTISHYLSRFDENMVESLLKAGKIVIFLDGYDELYSALKRKIDGQISDLSYKYPNARIIVSGRPDERFTAWSEFEELSILPLSKKKCLSLISRASHPEEAKKKFYSQVEHSLFSTHREYLANPLMAYVMLFTSDQFVDFPSDIGAFYSKAFETLVRGHDVMKSDQYIREVNCDLKIKDLENVFGYFCALSFKDQCYEYSFAQARGYLKKALALCEFEFQPDNILEDFEKNYCVLILDASKYNFIHRTFQEFFAAQCLSSSEIIDYYDYNNYIIERDMESRRYFSMLTGVGAEKFIAKFFSNIIKEFVSVFYPIRNRQPRKFLELILGEIGVDENGSVRMVAYGESKRLFFIAYNLLPIYDEERFKSIFLETENMDVLEDVEFTNLHGLNLKVVDIANIPRQMLIRLNLYHSFKNIVERARILDQEIERRNAKLKRMVSRS